MNDLHLCEDCRLWVPPYDKKAVEANHPETGKLRDFRFSWVVTEDGKNFIKTTERRDAGEDWRVVDERLVPGPYQKFYGEGTQ
ncbi:MAG TPA: hypothetical protein VNA25_17925 [Phycisphaerae bacterium]|nr:hypothetical protein [Phycisphaerae bacterium]